MRSFAVDHVNHPALGYVVLSKKDASLKSAYRGLKGKEIGDLVRSGINVKDEPLYSVEVGFTGDTCAAGLGLRMGMGMSTTTTTMSERLRRSDLYRGQALRYAPLLLCEMTYLGDDDNGDSDDAGRGGYDGPGTGIALAEERGYMHVLGVERLLSTMMLETATASKMAAITVF